jgi:demethoxyubiquinone hydroxylase (CLK1/Coq7/Cat5 family)
VLINHRTTLRFNIQISLSQDNCISSFILKIGGFNFLFFIFYYFNHLYTNAHTCFHVFAVPGIVASSVRHLASLRHLKRDHGWIHTLWEEAENERMHLLCALAVKRPGPITRVMVFLSQGIFYNFFFLSYLISPRFCHNLVGYLEEEAVKTYTHCLEEIDQGENLIEWRTEPAPSIAIEYWKLPRTATIRDMLAMMRRDEAHHREVNHTFASLQQDEPNPFPPSDSKHGPVV